eukprot:1361584-Amphidinium_carterae.1
MVVAMKMTITTAMLGCGIGHKPIPRQQAVAGKHDTMQAIASTISPRHSPQQGTHSAKAYASRAASAQMNNVTIFRQE